MVYSGIFSFQGASVNTLSGTKLLISNLPLTVDSSDLEDMFTIVGDVRVAKVERNLETGTSIGIGRVEMSNIQQAQDCIEHFNGQSTQGHVLAVREDKPHVPRRPLKTKGRQTKRSKS